MFRQRQRQIHKQLAGVVGDPHAEESTWMTACLAAGEKSLVKADHGARFQPLMPVARSLAITSIGLNILLAWGTLGVLCQQLILLMGGPGEEWYRQSMGMGPGLGMLLTFFATCGFWPRFCSSTEAVYSLRSYVFYGALVATIAALSFNSSGAPAGLLVAAIGAIAYFPAVKLAAYTRRTLSSTFRFDRTVLFCGLTSVPGAALMALVIYQGMHGMYSTSTPMNAFSFDRLATLAAFLAFSTMLPAYVCARVSRAQTIPTCLALNAIFNAPLLAGVFLCALVTTLTCVDPTNLFNSGTLIAGCWGIFLAPLALTGSGSALAARRNAMQARQQLIKAGYHHAIESEA